MLETEYSGFTMPVDALARIGKHVELLHSEFGLLLLNRIQDMIRNVNTFLMIFKTIQHVNS